MPLYQLTLFYPNLKEHAGKVRDVRADVEAIAGKNWRVLSAGEQVCAIAFETDATHAQLSARFRSVGGERFLFLLAEFSAVVAGYLSPDVWLWIDTRLPRKR
ncbi:MAG TPA: hypothetical protein VFV71_13000 [Burkholderiales bacterium]|nr:hypothetical protein [Burkholderiales bacterium]